MQKTWEIDLLSQLVFIYPTMPIYSRLSDIFQSYPPVNSISL